MTEKIIQILHSTENMLCIRSRYCMAVDLEPLLPISVLQKPIA